MTGHIIAGILVIVEHVNGTTLGGWALLVVCWVLFYVAAYNFYAELVRNQQEEVGRLHSALTTQREDFAGLRDTITTRDSQIGGILLQLGQLKIQADQLNREISTVSKRPELSLEFGPVENLPGGAFFEQSELLLSCSISNAYSIFLEPSTLTRDETYTLRQKYHLQRIEAGGKIPLFYRVCKKIGPGEKFYGEADELSSVSWCGRLAEFFQGLDEYKEGLIEIPLSIRYCNYNQDQYRVSFVLVYGEGIIPSIRTVGITTQLSGDDVAALSLGIQYRKPTRGAKSDQQPSRE